MHNTRYATRRGQTNRAVSVRGLSRILAWVVLCACLVSPPAESQGAGRDSRAAARINGKPIPVEPVQRLAADIAKSAQTSIDQVWRDALEQLITSELLVQEATAKGIRVSDAEVEAEIRELRSLGDGHPLVEWIRSTPAAQVRQEVQRSLLVEKLLSQRVRVKIDRKQVEEYYRAHQDRFQRPPMVRASHILIKIEGNRSTAEQRAKDLLARARQGEDFATLARQFSQDPLTKEKGGDLGFFPEHPTPLAQAAFRLDTGEISDVIETPYGLHILKVTGRRPAGVAPLEEVFGDIQEMLEEEERDEREEKLIEELRARAKVEILLETPPNDTSAP